jgi:hypothetical protein
VNTIFEGYQKNGYSVIAKGKDGNLVFNSFSALNSYMEQVDPSKPFNLQGDLILFTFEFDFVAFRGIEGSISVVIDLDHPLTESGINISGASAGGINVGIGVGGGYVKGDVEGFTPLTVDVNLGKASVSVITDGRGVNGLVATVGPGFGASASSQYSWTLCYKSVRDLWRRFTKQ